MLQLQSDDRLLALARRGHEPAFEALVRRYRKPLLDYGQRVLTPTAAAEDAVQQGLLQAWAALQRGTEVKEVGPWLFQIVRNAALRTVRSCGEDCVRLSESLEATSTLEADFERRAAAHEALTHIAALPALQREALVATAIDGRTHDQVASTLGLSHGAVRGLVYRARRTLRAAASALMPFMLVSWAARKSAAGLSPRNAALRHRAGRRRQ